MQKSSRAGRNVRLQQMLVVAADLQSAACSPAAGGARPPAVGTTAQPYTAGRPTPPLLIARHSGHARGEPARG